MARVNISDPFKFGQKCLLRHKCSWKVTPTDTRHLHRVWLTTSKVIHENLFVVSTAHCNHIFKHQYQCR